MFTNLRATSGEPTTKDLDVSIDIGKTLAVVILGTVLFVIALILYLNEKDTAGASFVAIGEAIVMGGLGIAVGEAIGANAAANRLKSR